MNELEETLRVLDTQINEYKKRLDELKEAISEFTETCNELLYFSIIHDMLFNYKNYLEEKYAESITAKKEIMDKYDIK